MKPCNFPERRNQRRIRAMARIVASPALYRHSGKGEQVRPVVLPNQRAVRSKKDRRNRAKVAA